MIKNQKNNLNVFPSIDELNKATAELIVSIAQKATEQRGRFTICLSGGNTPKSLYSLLAARPYLNLISWKNTFVFWGDERCVPGDDDQNNAFMATTTLLKKTPVSFYNIFPIPVQLPPSEAAKRYEETLKIFFGVDKPVFDLVLLGLGVNGHTASLFPGTAVLYEENKWVSEVYVEEQKMHRITLTATLINKASHILFLVSGEEKSGILKNILSGPYQPDKYPAQLIQPENGELLWFADEKAAGLLKTNH